jgi:hypothetical protein
MIFRPPQTLGLGLAGDRARHVGGKVDVLDLDDRDPDPPRRRRLADDLLQVRLDLVALGEQLVEHGLRAPSVAWSARSASRDHDVLDLDDRGVRVDDAEVGNGG